MSNSIKGVNPIIKDNYSIFYIESLTDELKEVIRKDLSSICHGPADAESGRSSYSYKSTLKEFVKRYSTKRDTHQKGMIGELLLHIIMLELLDDFEVDSPFFNLEERSAKKGFDVVVNKKSTNELWITEVKSGEQHKDKDTSGTAIELINAAKNDLIKRLNGDSIQLWNNAVHGAKIAIHEHRDSRKAIISLLEDLQDAANEDSVSSDDLNVILVGTVFNNLNDRINELQISNKHTSLNRKSKFKKICLIAIQKSTYQAVFDFLESESKKQ